MNIKDKRQLSCTVFLAKYGSLDIYDEYLGKIFIIDHKQLQFDKHYGWGFIGIPDKPDGNLSGRDYFCIHNDIIDQIQLTHQDKNIMWEYLSNEPNGTESQSEATEICDENTQNKKRSITKKSSKHTIQIKRWKRFVDYRDKLFDDFGLMIVDPLKKLDGEESNIISSSFGISSEKQSNEVISKMLLTHHLKRWEESKTQAHPSSSVTTPSEHISLQICCIILK